VTTEPTHDGVDARAAHDVRAGRGVPETQDGDDVPEVWRAWGRQRPQPRGRHLDCAAAGRCSWDAQHAVAEHLRREAELGAYVAQAEAAPVIEGARTTLAALLGVPADGLAFLESASAALAAVLRAWPLGERASVAVVPTEWAPNIEAFRERGLELVELRTEEHGRVDLSHLEQLLTTSPPSFVHLTQVTSHRALLQPVAEAADLCRAAGVALWVDAAQALGHVDTATGADVVYATSRKWMCGPRGVGLLGVAPRWWDLLYVRHHVLAPADEPVVRAMESDEANVAGRVGLATSVNQFAATGPAAVWARLDEVGRQTRHALADLPGWQVVDATDAGTAITALRPTAGQDAVAARARLLSEHGILTTVSTPARAPRDLAEPMLRISPHVDCAGSDLDALAGALASC